MSQAFVETPHVSAPPEGDLPDRRAGDVVQWALSRFASWRIGITTAFGMEGCALVDMIARTNVPVRIAWMDTHFLFPETHALRERMVRRYPHLTFVNIGTDYTPEAQARDVGDRLWERDPGLCCAVRKVDPMRAWLKEHDVWVTSIRREQSTTRADIATVAWDTRFDVLKVSPLAWWSREDVWSYITTHDVPWNPLHAQGYPTIGCTHCTRPVEGATVLTYSREGRWAGTGRTECGLHGSPGDTRQ